MKAEKFNLDELAAAWPSPIVPRDQACLDKFSGGLLNQRTLANADSAGTGPKQKLKLGRKVAYPKNALVEWMRSKGLERE